MKIKTYILKKDRTVEELKVKLGKGYFTHDNGLYCITSSVTLRAKEDPSHFNTVPEMFFYQDNPVPINEKERKGPEFLEDFVIENALRDTGKPRGRAFLNLVNTLTDPGKLLGIVVALGVGFILIRFVLYGGI